MLKLIKLSGSFAGTAYVVALVSADSGLATADIAGYIAFYNDSRRHSDLGGLSPV